MSRAELVCELITPSYPVSNAGTPETYSACCTAALASDALVSHKLSVARELLLRDLIDQMKSGPVMDSPATVSGTPSY